MSFSFFSLTFPFLQHSDNELITLEVIHRYVELLDKYFGSVRFKYKYFAMIHSFIPFIPLSDSLLF
jgi:hypothetical protein